MSKTNAEVQALADEIKRLAAEMSRQDVSAAMSDTSPIRRTLDAAKATERAFSAAIDRLAAMAQTPAGWVLVPVYPTQMMVERACESIDHLGVRWSDMREAYEAALAAAPKPEQA